MAIVSEEAIANHIAELETERQSFADELAEARADLEELAEVKAERDALKVEITRMMVDRQLAV